MAAVLRRDCAQTPPPLCTAYLGVPAAMPDIKVTAQAEKRSVIKGEMTVGGKWVDIRRGNFDVNERLTSA